MAQNATVPVYGPSVPLAVTADEVAELLGVSRAHVWRLHSSGRLPSPVRFGRAVRWDRQMLAQWLAAGAPPRVKWEEMNKTNRRP
jgi:excisionase family DNA binding protein